MTKLWLLSYFTALGLASELTKALITPCNMSFPVSPNSLLLSWNVKFLRFQIGNQSLLETVFWQFPLCTVLNAFDTMSDGLAKLLGGIYVLTRNGTIQAICSGLVAQEPIWALCLDNSNSL